MRTLSASEAKGAFGELLDRSGRGPVRIEKKGRGVAVLLSVEEYERLSEIEDQWWADRARRAAKKGFVGKAKSKQILEGLLNARD